MPEFIKPQRAVIETGGDDWLGLILLVAFIAALVLLGAAVAAFAVAHAVLLGSCLLAFVAVVVGLPVAWRIRYREREPLPLPRGLSAGHELASERIALDAPPLALPAARPALPSVVHHHIHFHGVTAGEAAEIINRREIQP